MKVCCGVIYKNGKILLLKKASGSYKGKYEFPGGKYEDKDSNLENCILREIKEELNCVSVVNKFILHDKIEKDVFGFDFDLYFYHIELIDNHIQLSDEHTDYIWIDLDKVNNINMLETDYKYIETFKQFFKS